MPYRFSPPIASPAVSGLVRALAPLVLRLRDQLVRVEFSGLERLAALRGQRALLLPNHPSETEPPVMALLARQLGEPFFFLATHELFQGFDGWIAQRMGAFSVRRGWPDRASLTFATQLLTKNNKLVVFPEGETHLRGNEILPLKHGAAQLGFWALQKNPSPLPLVPLHISYRYVQPYPRARALGQLQAMLYPPGHPMRQLPSHPEHLLPACGWEVLVNIEREYGLPPAPLTPEERIARVYQFIEDRACHALGCKPPHADTVPVRLRTLFNAAFDFRDGLAHEPTPYGQQLHHRRQLATDAVLADLWRAQNFMAVRDESPTTEERFGELVFRLEKEVFGKPKTLPLRIASVRVGEPLELSEYAATYERSRKAALATVTDEIEKRLNALLTEALATETPFTYR